MTMANQIVLEKWTQPLEEIESLELLKQKGENIADNMVQYKELCRISTCFSSSEVKADNLDNCSVLNENIAVVCQE